ncbi:hypothetical protein DRO24_04875 [Candidatus Bathyarchaeota archaeon]|nr:MAG: hypothetical protein DRO24_04875 [Candidatus Bathyarchaeota archaeon]
MEWRCVETGRGSEGSIFVCFKDPREPGIVVRALRIDRTLGGLQIWKIQVEGKPKASEQVYVRRRTEIKGLLTRLLKSWEERGLI